MTIELNKWNTNKSRRPPRVQSADEVMEIYKQVTTLLEAGTIQHSKATNYSQVLLTKKDSTPPSWRMCIDYWYLNSCTDTMYHPIPNINIGESWESKG